MTPAQREQLYKEIARHNQKQNEVAADIAGLGLIIGSLVALFALVWFLRGQP